MDQIKPLESLTLPRGSLNVTLDALLVERWMGRVTRRVTEDTSSGSSGRPPPPVVARAPKSGSRETRSSWVRGRSRLSSEEASGVISERAGDTGLARAGSKCSITYEAFAPAPKKFWSVKRYAPALPPLEEKKETSVVPLLSALDPNPWNNRISEVYCGTPDAVHTCNVRQLEVVSRWRW